MSTQCASQALRISETVAAACSFALNLLLVVVVLRCRTKELRVYSRLILCNCAVDTMFAVASYVIEPHGDIRAGIFMVFNNGVNFGFDDFTLFLFFHFSLYAAVMITAVPMAYRDIALSGKQIVALISIALFLATPVTVAVWLVWGSASRRTAVELAEHIRSYPCHDEREVYIGKDLADVAPPCLLAAFLLPLIYGSVVFCAVKVHRLIRSSSLGGRKQELQQQIGWALLAQATAPVFTMFLPLGTIIVVASFGLEGLHGVLMSTSSFCSYIPVLNPVMTLYFIKPYRKFIIRICRRHSATVNSHQQLT
ncbi:7TM GPCR protein [Aphelenchoides avenae]|nr:7TM GPCR protein [Aphelenchus avenae]